MTKHSAMTDQEKLSIVESKLRKHRLSAKNTSSLLRQHDRLQTKIAGRGPGRPPNPSSGLSDDDVLANILGDRSAHELSPDDERILLESLDGDTERAVWAVVRRIEDERRAQAKAEWEARANPKQDDVRSSMSIAAVEEFYRERRTGHAAPPSQPIQADID